MSSSSALNYNIQNKPSLFAKVLVMMFFLSNGLFLLLLWGVGWFSFLFLILYLATSTYFVCSLKLLPLACLLSDAGGIEIKQPIQIMGNISPRSFYNGWIIFLCVDITDPLLVSNKQKHNNLRKWFVVFYDSITEKEYHLFARLIKSKSLS